MAYEDAMVPTNIFFGVHEVKPNWTSDWPLQI